MMPPGGAGADVAAAHSHCLLIVAPTQVRVWLEKVRRVAVCELWE